MKINVRLLLITFVVIVIISLTSTIIHYSLTNSLLKSQHSKTLLYSVSDFAFSFQRSVEDLEEDIKRLINNSNDIYSINLDSTKIDFIFKLNDEKKIESQFFNFSSSLSPSLLITTIDEFNKAYPGTILRYINSEDYATIFYGRLIDENYLDEIAEKIRANVVLVINKLPFTFSNSIKNNQYLPNLVIAAQEFVFKNNYDLYYEELQSVDFLAANFKPKNLITTDASINFIIFTVPSEASEYRATMRIIMIIIALAAVLLSLILILLFTTKLRKQISLLSSTAEISAGGDLSHRVPIISNDELGIFGRAFNSMLDQLQNKEKIETEYTEFITLINENPSLIKLSDSVLEKIIKSSGLSFGALYMVENDTLKTISTYGLNKNISDSLKDQNFYKNIIDKQQEVELTFDENYPSLNTGMVEINIKYLLVTPIVFHKNVISIIELASEHIPDTNPSQHLNNIKEQLAIGLNNAISFEQLKQFVQQLKLLNEDIQKQNDQITGQNLELKELHKELKENAEELEEQRKKAVELTHVKSQFLANMSHELRTPLNSILGLTELIEDDSTTFPKTKDRLKIVLRNGKKLLAMINNILEFSKIESGELELTKSNFTVSEFMNDIYMSMEPLVMGKDIDFGVIFDSDYDLLINTDKHKLEQVLLNLLSNAFKFTEVGSVKIKVEVIDNVSLKIDVIDTGIGISDDDKKRIFDEFKQADLGLSRKYQGAGLGLAICRKYIELLGGKISVKSNDFKGSTFTLFLPKIILEKLALSDIYKFQKSTSQTKTDRKKLLFIHNDDASKVKVANYFEDNGYDVIQSKPNFEIISQMEGVELDGIITNTSTLTKDIWTLIREIKDNPLTSRIPLSIITTKGKGDQIYGLNVFEIISPLQNITTIKYYIDLIEIKNNEIKNIIWLTKPNKINDEIKTQIESYYNLTTVNSNQEFEKTILNSSPDLIIIDAFLEEDSQLSFTHQLATSTDLPIILLLPHDLNDVVSQNLSDDLNLLAVKNSSPKELALRSIDLKFTEVKKLTKGLDVSVEEKDDSYFSEKAKYAKPKSEDRFHVLVVDDDKDTLFTVGEILQNIGCEISFANNGVECLSALTQITPDLILLDIMMPEMDGFETIKKIRTNKKTAKLIVYAITAHAMLDDINVIKSNGFDDLITKPINSSTISFKVQQVIEQKLG